MSTVILNMPRLGETMEEGTVSEWLVAVGTTFERGAPLIEFETDKTAVEYPALGSGRLVETLVQSGDLVKVGDPIAEIDLEGGDDWISGEVMANPPAASPASAAADEAGGDDTVVIDLLMPRLGETMDEGTIVGWLVEVGDTFARGAAILEVETDKTVAEFPALVPGRLVEILVGADQVVPVDTPIARIEVAQNDTAAPEASRAAEPVGAPEAAAVAASEADPQTIALAQPVPAAGTPVRATPLARRAARRAGLRIETIRGNGRRGRIELADVERAAGGTEASGLSATTWGSPAASSILLVHGFAGDRTTFERLGRALARSGLGVRAVDLPGHGETAQDAMVFGDLVDALAGELNPARPIHLVGHSLGAAAAIAAAARAGGVASLTLIAPAGLGVAIDATFVEGMAAATSPAAVSHLLRRLSDRAERFSAAEVDRIHADLARGRLRALAATLAHDGQQTLNLRSQLAALSEEVPVRIVLGLDDQIINARDAMDVSPAIALHLFPRAGHMPHWDAPGEVTAIIERAVRHG